MKELRCSKCNTMRGKIDDDGTYHLKMLNQIDLIAQIKTMHLICHRVFWDDNGNRSPCESKMVVECKDGIIIKDGQCLIGV